MARARGALLVAVLVVARGAASSVHVILTVADDLGYALAKSDAARDIATPAIDALRRDGVELLRHYAHYSCAPTRSSLLTGRQPLHVNVENSAPERSNPLDPVSGYAGPSLAMTLLAEKLQPTHATFHVGKWDLGYATANHTPLARGFDHSIGFFHHYNDAWTAAYDGLDCNATAVDGAWHHKPSNDDDDQQYFASADTETTDTTTTPYRDLWQDAAPSPRALDGATYEDDLFAQRAAAIVAQPRGRPLFLYYAPHLVHGPYQPPDDYLANFSDVNTTLRRKMCALVNKLDAAVGAVADAARSNASFWDRLAWIFLSDNGGPVVTGDGTGVGASNNYPLRGGKYSPLEGGIRVRAFVTGGLVPAPRRGTATAALSAVADWYATICALANVSAVDDKAAAASSGSTTAESSIPPVDSFDLWPAIVGDVVDPHQPQRAEVVIAATTRDRSAASGSGVGPEAIGLVTEDGWKCLAPASYAAFWTGPQYPNASSLAMGGAALSAIALDCTVHGGCLFNLTADPLETTDLAATYPDVLVAKLARLAELNASAFRPDRGAADPAPACAAARDRYGGVFGPWLP